MAVWTRTRSVTVAAGVVLAAALLPVPASGSEHRDVDQSRLQPPLLERFAPWDCRMKQSGPVCTGEGHVVGDRELTDLPCDVAVWGARTEHRYQTLFFDHDYRNYYRRNRTNEVDAFSTSPDGPTTGSVSTTARYFYTYGVPGDLDTVTITTSGVIWDLRPAHGPAIFRAVGTLVEPAGQVPTFSGRVTIDGEGTNYQDVPLDSFLTDERFVNWLCRATTGAPAVL